MLLPAAELARCAIPNRSHFHRLRPGLYCRIHLGRRIAFDPEPVHHWAAGVERSLDHDAGGLLPAGAYEFLGSAQDRRPDSMAIPSSERAFARRLGRIALSGPATP